MINNTLIETWGKPILMADKWQLKHLYRCTHYRVACLIIMTFLSLRAGAVAAKEAIDSSIGFAMEESTFFYPEYWMASDATRVERSNFSVLNKKVNTPGINRNSFIMGRGASKDKSLIVNGQNQSYDLTKGDAITLTNSGSALANRTTFTLEFWAKFTTVSGTINLVDFTGTADAGGLILNSGKLTVDLLCDFGCLTESNALNLGTGIWYHIAVVFDNGTWDFYVNGEPQGLGVLDQGALSSVPDYASLAVTNLVFGRQNHTSIDDFVGSIDDIRLWSSARTQMQIQSKRNEELVGSESGLLGYWKLNESSGTTVNDSQTNTNLLTGTSIGITSNPTGAFDTTPIPSISSATYDAATGALVVTGTDLKARSGANNDIIANKFTLRGQGGSTYTLNNTADVDITSNTMFTLMLSPEDKASISMMLNKNGNSALDGTTYNLAANEDWAAGTDPAVLISDLTNSIRVSNVNSTPTFGGLHGDQVSWPGPGNTVILDYNGNATVADAEMDASNWGGSSLTVQRRGSSLDRDVFGFNPLSYSVNGSNLMTGGSTTFGTFTNAAGVMTITFNNNATNTLVQDVLRSITYRNDTPAGDAIIRFTLNDGNSSTTADVTVNSDRIYITNATDNASINLADGVSFSEAIAIAAADVTGGQTIVFTEPAAFTINNVSINESLTFDMDLANGMSLSGGTITLNGSNLTFTNGTIATISSLIAGSGEVTKTGSGTLILSGNHTYSGTTTVSAGTLVVNDSLKGTTSVSVGSGATITGAGSVNSLTVNNGGTLSPGINTGIFTVNGNLTMNRGSNLDIQINGVTAGSGYDQVLVYGNVNVNQPNLLVKHGYSAGQGDSYTIIVNDMVDPITGTFTGLAEGSTVTAAGNGMVLTASYIGGTANDFTLTAPMNAAPVISNLNGDAVLYTEKSAFVLLDAGNNAIVTDSDSHDFDGGHVRVSITANGSMTQDILSVRNQGTSAVEIGASGLNITYGGNVIGTRSAVSGSGLNDLVITLNSAATAAIVQELVRNLTYTNTNTYDPSTLARTIAVTIDDGDGGTSNAAIVSVSVTAVNDAPTLTATALNPTFTEGGAAVPMFSHAQSSTIEAGQLIQSLKLTLSGVGNGDNEELMIDGILVKLSNGTITTIQNRINIKVANSGTEAEITLMKTEGMTTSLINTIINGISYRNASGNPTVEPRTVTLTRIEDNGGTANGGLDISSLSIVSTVNVVAVNDDPLISGPVGISVMEDVPKALKGITFSDIDAGSNAVTVTLSVPSGSLSATSSMDVTVGGTSSRLTLDGSIANINAFIAAGAVTFTTASNATPNVVLSIKINDNGHTGSGGEKVIYANITLAVTAVNDAPVNAVPGAQFVNQGANLIFSTANSNPISISDVDAGTGSVRVTLTATNGLITLAGTTGLSFLEGSGTGDSKITFEGTIANINTALNGMVFSPTAGYNGSATLQITTNDLGNTGSGGALSDTDNILITVNPIHPKVISVGSSTANGTYKLGDAISVMMTFDQEVSVSSSGGIPTLLLETGSVDRSAVYSGGSGSKTLTFNYRVLEGDRSVDLDYHSTTALSLNGATIQNTYANDAILTLPAVGSANSLAGQHNIVIDGIVPTVTSVAVPVSGYYTEGQALDFTVNFSEPVSITGMPRLSLTIGSQTVSANYLSGTGSSSLVFGYTIIAGLQDHDGITVGALSLEGGTLKDAAGNNANLILNSVGSTSEVTVDSRAPLLILNINNGVTHTNNPKVNLDIQTTDTDIIGLEFSNDGMTWTQPESFVISKVWNLESGDGVKKVYVRAKDLGGNITAVNAAITLDQTAPIVTGVANGVLYNSDRTITFNEGGATLNGALFTSGTIVVADGVYTLIVTDVASNSTTVAFTIDKTAPAVPANFKATGQNAEIALDWTANTESDFEKYILYVQPEGEVKSLLTSIPKGTEQYTYSGLPNGKNYKFFLIAEDQLGNQSPEALASAKTMGEQTISFSALANLTYGQQGIALTASATSKLQVSYSSSDSDIAEVYQDNNDGGKWKINTKKAGTVTITATQAGSHEYLAATAVRSPLTIVPAVLRVSAEQGQSKVYGEKDPILTYVAKGFQFQDNVKVLKGGLSRVEGEDAGTYGLERGSITADNYTIDFVPSDFTINKKQQVLNFAAIKAVSRDAGLIPLDIARNSGLPIQVFSSNLLVAEVQSAQEVLVKGVGRSQLRVEQAGDANHLAAEAVEQTLEVLHNVDSKLPVLLHQAVSPDGDGINDFLRIEGIDLYPENKLVIFDANGSIVQTIVGYDNHSRVFNGIKGGRPVPNATYFYTLAIKVDGKWLYDKGFFVVRF